eukprot:scaffold2128_cov87-Cylindrotheca_fusiformis.AAC.2
MLLQRALFLFSCIAVSCDGFIPNNKLEAPQIVSPAGGGTRTRFSSSSSKSWSSTTRPRIIQSRELFQAATITTIKASSSSSAAAADVMPSSSLSVYDSPLLSSRKNNNNGGVNVASPSFSFLDVASSTFTFQRYSSTKGTGFLTFILSNDSANLALSVRPNCCQCLVDHLQHSRFPELVYPQPLVKTCLEQSSNHSQ